MKKAGTRASRTLIAVATHTNFRSLTGIPAVTIRRIREKALVTQTPDPV